MLKDSGSFEGHLIKVSVRSFESKFSFVATHLPNQWIKWTSSVIPSLVPHYFALSRRTKDLADINREYSSPCTCMQAQHCTLNVTCVYFDGMSPNFFLLYATLTVLSYYSDYRTHLSMHTRPTSSFRLWPHGVLTHSPHPRDRYQIA